MDYAFNAKVNKHYIITDAPSGAVNGRPCFRREESRHFAQMRPDEIEWCFLARMLDPNHEIVFPKDWYFFRLQEREDSITSNSTGAKRAGEILNMLRGK